MEYLIGVVAALAISIGASAIGMDRERSFYPTVLAVVATYYALFAVMAGSTHALLSEAVPIALFLLAAVTGFRKALWWVVIGLVGHGLFDLLHGHLISNPGVPAWWPGWCLACDLTAGTYLAFLLKRSKAKKNRPDRLEPSGRRCACRKSLVAHTAGGFFQGVPGEKGSARLCASVACPTIALAKVGLPNRKSKIWSSTPGKLDCSGSAPGLLRLFFCVSH
jgi:hypothetical protein